MTEAVTWVLIGVLLAWAVSIEVRMHKGKQRDNTVIQMPNPYGAVNNVIRKPPKVRNMIALRAQQEEDDIFYRDPTDASGTVSGTEG